MAVTEKAANKAGLDPEKTLRNTTPHELGLSQSDLSRSASIRLVESGARVRAYVYGAG